MNDVKDVVSRIQRELPDTDRSRYDVAYERGKTQARSGLLFGGLALGAIGGAVTTLLLDPVRGAGRRAQLASRLTGLRNDIARVAGGRVKDLQNRAKGAAIETGIRKPDDFADTASAATNTTPADDKLPGANVPDPLTPEELSTYGSGGPVAGAATAAATEDAERERATI